eukprot:2029879-Alexandrium_andersonii.AAC.1
MGGRIGGGSHRGHAPALHFYHIRDHRRRTNRWLSGLSALARPLGRLGVLRLVARVAWRCAHGG